MVEQVDDGIIYNSTLGLISKLHGVQEWFDQGPELFQDKSLQGLDVEGQCHRSGQGRTSFTSQGTSVDSGSC